VIGGGAVGCSLLYHLSRRGWADSVLIERGELTGGSTWHAAGLCTQFNSSFNLTKLLMYSLDLYEQLETETASPVDLRRVGSIRLATTADRVDEFRQRAAMAEVLGLEIEILDRSQARDLFPLAKFDDVEAVAHVPSDGYIDPNSVTHALAKGARDDGCTIARHTAVEGLARSRSGSWLVETNRGRIEAEVVVNAGGIWAPEVAALVSARLPLVPLQHQYVVTEPIAEVGVLTRELPVLRDPHASYYVRQEGGGLLIGPFERAPQTWAEEAIPSGFEQQLLAPNLLQIEAVLEAAAERIPSFGDAGIRTVVNGPDAYTPDGRCLMGEVPGLPGFHVLAGFSIFGIVFAGGAGKYAAEWIVDGQPSDNMWELDVRRFGTYANARRYVRERAREVYEREYAIHYPHEELPAGRPLKTSPLHATLAARGAVFGSRSGWERPLWFAPEGIEPADELTFRTPNWHEHVGAECRAVRERVGVLDQTSFAKYKVAGRDAFQFLDRLCANTLPRAVGGMALTQMLTHAGGIECDVTVTRLDEDSFYLVSAAATEAHDLAWIERHAEPEEDVRIENVTSRYGVLTVAGPESRDLLARLSDDGFGNDVFPFFTARQIEVGSIPVLALRVSYVGELGWELHHPLEYQLALYELLWSAGLDLGLVDFGYRALESMRLEKGYRLWGADISADYSPFEAGLERFVALDKGDFVGRTAILERRHPERVLSCLTVSAGRLEPHGSEPVSLDGEIVAYVMSGGYGHTCGTAIAYAYLPISVIDRNEGFSIRILDENYPAVVAREPLHDPRNKRLRS
jgi:dimethylglycine dehydrogenase